MRNEELGMLNKKADLKKSAFLFSILHFPLLSMVVIFASLGN